MASNSSSDAISEKITSAIIKSISALNNVKSILINLLERIEQLEKHDKSDVSTFLTEEFLDQDITISIFDDQLEKLDKYFSCLLFNYGLIKVKFLNLDQIIILTITNTLTLIENKFNLYLIEKDELSLEGYYNGFTIYKIEEI